MAFTTKGALKKDKPELFPGETVLIQVSYTPTKEGKTNTKFILNKDSMGAFNMIPNKPNLNNITWGLDDVTKQIMLANISGVNETSKITEKNTFSNKELLEKLVEDFNIDPSKENIFSLDIFEENGIFVANIKLYKEPTTEDNVMEEPYPGYNEAIDKVANQSFDEMVNEAHETNEMF